MRFVKHSKRSMQLGKEPIVKFPDGQLGIVLFRYQNSDCLYLLGDGRIIRLGPAIEFEVHHYRMRGSLETLCYD